MVSWDPVWEEIFSSRSWGEYPPEDLVRFVARNFYHAPNRSDVRILDLGCGPGSCSWYVAREGFLVSGIDGSPTAIRQAQERLAAEGLHGDFRVGDFLDLPWPDDYFDGVVDIVSLASNTLTASQHVVAEVYRVLKPGGRFFSITFKDGCWGDGLGERIELHTFGNIAEGPCANIGVIRFSPEEEIRQLYGLFEELNLEHSVRSVDNMAHVISHWLVSCRKLGNRDFS